MLLENVFPSIHATFSLSAHSAESAKPSTGYGGSGPKPQLRLRNVLYHANHETQCALFDIKQKEICDSNGVYRKCVSG